MPTEAINGRLEHLCGSALEHRNLTNYNVRSPLETGGPDHYYTLDHEEPRRPIAKSGTLCLRPSQVLPCSPSAARSLSRSRAASRVVTTWDDRYRTTDTRFRLMWLRCVLAEMRARRHLGRMRLAGSLNRRTVCGRLRTQTSESPRGRQPFGRHHPAMRSRIRAAMATSALTVANANIAQS